MDFDEYEVGVIIETSEENDIIFKDHDKIKACHQYCGIACDYYEGEFYYFQLINKEIAKLDVFHRDWNYKLHYTQNGMLSKDDLSEADAEKLKWDLSKKYPSVEERREIIESNPKFITRKEHIAQLQKYLNQYNKNKEISDIVVEDFEEAFCPCLLTYGEVTEIKGFIVWHNCD